MKINEIKNQFPIFKTNPDLVYLDNGATTLKPQMVLDKMNEYYTSYSANIHRGIYEISEKATEEYELARTKLKKFINGEEGELVFTRGTTEAVNLVAQGWGEKNINEGDEILVTQMEHHANLLPWQVLAKKKGAALKYIELENFELKLETLEQLISSKTKILALTYVSNVLGTINPIKEIVNRAKQLNPEILVLVDGAQAMAHLKVDVADLGCDFLAFSGHKMYGPTGIGGLWSKKNLLNQMEPIFYGGGMIKEVTWQGFETAEIPDKFEGGTPPIAEAIGLGAAVDFLEGMGMDSIMAKENEITEYAYEKLKTIPGLTIYGPKNSVNQSGILAITLDGVHAHDVGAIAAQFSVAVRSGHHCAMPLHTLMGVLATTRISFGVYNTKEDIDQLILSLQKAVNLFQNKVQVV